MATVGNLTPLLLAATVPVCVLIPGCGNPGSPSTPTSESPAIAAEQIITTAQPRSSAGPGPSHNYRTSMTLRARGAVGATITRVTTTLTEISGTTTVFHLSVIEAFGAIRHLASYRRLLGVFSRRPIPQVQVAGVVRPQFELRSL